MGVLFDVTNRDGVKYDACTNRDGVLTSFLYIDCGMIDRSMHVWCG